MKRKGFTLLEMMVGIGVMSIVLVTCFTLFSTTLRSFWRTDTRLDLTQQSALAVRRVSQEIRSAVAVSIANDGKALYYELPLKNNFPDPVTGEYELVEPLQSDGVVRSFQVVEGTLYHYNGTTGDERAIVRDMSLIDPEPQSAYYNQPYPVFSFPSVGSATGVQILIVARRPIAAGEQYTRMSTIVNLRNVQ